MDKFNEPGYVSPEDDTREEEIIQHEEFVDFCLGLYDEIKCGTRKQRKKAAQTLVILACGMEQALVELADQVGKEKVAVARAADKKPEQPEEQPAATGDAGIGTGHFDVKAPAEEYLVNALTK